MLEPCWLKNSPTNEDPVRVVASRRMCFCPPAADAALRWTLRVEFSRALRCCCDEASVETLCCAADRREALSSSSGVSGVSLGVSLSDTLRKTEETAVTHRVDKAISAKGTFHQKIIILSSFILPHVFQFVFKMFPFHTTSINEKKNF